MYSLSSLKNRFPAYSRGTLCFTSGNSTMIIGEGNDVVQSASRTAFSVALHRRHPDPGIATFIVHLPENKKLPKNHPANVSETTTTERDTTIFFLQPDNPRDR